MNPTADNRSCRSQARWIGVCPEGDQVRRRTGWSMKPLSSKKTMGLPLAAAPFLFGANPVFAIAPWPRRPLRVPAVRASGKSNPSREASSQDNLDDTRHGISARRPRQSADRSRSRCDTRPSVVRRVESRQVGVSASRSDEAFVRDVVWLSRHPCLLSPQPAAIASPKIPKRQGFPQSRQLPCLPGSTVLPAVGEIPVPLRFLSVSYLNIRIFVIYGSLAT